MSKKKVLPYFEIVKIQHESAAYRIRRVSRSNQNICTEIAGKEMSLSGGCIHNPRLNPFTIDRTMVVSPYPFSCVLRIIYNPISLFSCAQWGWNWTFGTQFIVFRYINLQAFDSLWLVINSCFLVLLTLFVYSQVWSCLTTVVWFDHDVLCLQRLDI